jgi:hypothetical protein
MCNSYKDHDIFLEDYVLKTDTKPSDISNSKQTKKEFIEETLKEDKIKKLDLAYHWKITADNEILVNMYGFPNGYGINHISYPDINKVNDIKDIKYVVVYARYSTIINIMNLVPKTFDSVELCLDSDKMYKFYEITRTL